MIFDVITPGDRMELVSMKNGFEQKNEKKRYSSKVLDLVDEETAKISMPIEKARVVPLEIGDKYQFCFYTGKGLFHCNGEVVERYKENLISVLVVKFDSDLEKFQRRQYYRLEYVMDIQYHIITPEERIYENRLVENKFENARERELCQSAYDTARNQWDLATIVDISGGGCKFNSHKKLEKDQKIKINIHYSYQKEEMTCIYEANIIFSEEIQNRRGYFEHRVEFIGINVKERETLIKFIFEEERKIRKKERGMG